MFEIWFLQVMLLQPGAWLGAFLEAGAPELALPAGTASTDMLQAALLQGEGLFGSKDCRSFKCCCLRLSTSTAPSTEVLPMLGGGGMATGHHCTLEPSPASIGC